MIENIVKKKPKEFALVTWIKRKIKRNQNCIALVEGPTGCLAHDTKLYKETKTIGQKYLSGERQIKTFSLNKNNEIVKSNSEIIFSGRKKVFEVKLKNGSSIKATKCHKLFISKDGVRQEVILKDLKIGDKLWCYPYTSKVVSIRKLGVIKTYDLNTPTYENFLLKGSILSHNSGKSYTCLSLAKAIDPDFNPSEQIIFYMSDFMKLINSETFQKKVWKIIIFEELQISASNRSWQSAMNKLLNYVLSTFRHQNIILLFNSPYRDFLDSQSMKLLHLIISMKSIDRKRKKAKIKPLLQDYNSKMKKTYEHSLYVLNEKGQGNKLAFMELGIPDETSIEIYEAKKREFTSKLNQEILAQVQELEKKSSKIVDDEKEEPLHQLKPNELMVYDWIKNNPDKFQKDYAKDLNLTGNKVSVLVNRIHKRGVNVRKYLKIQDNTNFLKNTTPKDEEAD